MTTYRVVRFCCLAGSCLQCRGEFNRSKRIPFVQANGLTEEMARKYASGWAQYEPKVEPET